MEHIVGAHYDTPSSKAPEVAVKGLKLLLAGERHRFTQRQRVMGSGLLPQISVLMIHGEISVEKPNFTAIFVRSSPEVGLWNRMKGKIIHFLNVKKPPEGRQIKRISGMATLLS